MNISFHGMIVAGISSRCGKTTAALALMAALARNGKQVLPFKAGPDYIDPSWHQAITGTPSHNLDTYMVGEAESRRLLTTTTPMGGVAVVEGVMGLYDGRDGIGGPGSTADLARRLGLPVVLVVDARGMAGSIAPLVDGFTRHADGFSIAGVLATRIGGESHAARLSDALASCNLPPLLGWLPRDERLAVKERHLGLILPGETRGPDPKRLAAALHMDLDALLAATALSLPPPSPRPATPPLLSGRTVAVARDDAFCFLYPANLEWLLEMGAGLRFFSPLSGAPFPSEADAAWLPGGYPELHGATLSRSPTWEGMRAKIAEGMPVLAECGGMMALGESLTDQAGTRWPMVGLLPIHTRMTGKLAGLGYRSTTDGARGHEFHHSVRDPCDLPGAFSVERGDPGIRQGSIRASYIHWYFPSAPHLCARWFLPDAEG